MIALFMSNKWPQNYVNRTPKYKISSLIKTKGTHHTHGYSSASKKLQKHINGMIEWPSRNGLVHTFKFYKRYHNILVMKFCVTEMHYILLN